MATAITRWDPASEFGTMRNVMDRLIEQSFGRIPAFRSGEDLGTSALGLDVYETNDSYVIKAAVPGVDPDKVDISVDDDILTIKGEFERKEEATEANYIRRELSYSAFQRSLRLPPTVDADHAKAEFEHGLLTLTLPKKPEAQARTIKITPQGVIDGSHKGDSQD